MATYVSSDMHGDYDALINVLMQANFCKNDRLFILGDIADRGKDFYKLFCLAKTQPNITLLLGNHEDNLISFIEELASGPNFTYDYVLSNAKLNDLTKFYMIQSSIESVADVCGKEKACDVLKNEVLPYLKTLPTSKEIEVNGKKFFLCHAGVDYSLPKEKQTKEILTRTRQPFNSQDKDFYGCTIVHGHTTTQVLSNEQIAGEVIFGKHKISIDGGASSKPNGRLNLLRLDDMQVFFCKSPKYQINNNQNDGKAQ